MGLKCHTAFSVIFQWACSQNVRETLIVQTIETFQKVEITVLFV